jgi:hypothetical protein
MHAYIHGTNLNGLVIYLLLTSNTAQVLTSSSEGRRNPHHPTVVFDFHFPSLSQYLPMLPIHLLRLSSLSSLYASLPLSFLCILSPLTPPYL